MKSQQEQIKMMTDRELRLNLYITQAIVLGLCVFLSYLFFKDWASFASIWKWEPLTIVLAGGGTALVIVCIDYAATAYLPERWFDDGGINERMFRGMSVMQLLIVTFIIGFGEELLFRGILQTKFGLLFASVVFALLHVRYVTKPFLFIFVLVISITLGYIFSYTGNLWVTVFAHFLVDFIMGLQLRKQKEAGTEREEGFFLYTVTEEDTLCSIGERYFPDQDGASILQIYNELATKEVKAGQVLKIPSLQYMCD